MALRFYPERGSHLPVLMKAVELTTGPILELGCGLYSTTPLHWACYVAKRKLVTYENNPDFYEFLKRYATDWHEVHCIDSWETVDLSGPWSVALVDHEAGKDSKPRRVQEAAKLLHAEYVVCHDTESRNEKVHNWSRLFPLFKYRYWYRDARPNTTVFSNIHDVTDFLGTGR